MITIGVPNVINLRSFVPVDDIHTMLISQTGRTDRPVDERELTADPNAFDEVGGYVERTHDPRSYFFTKANKRNDYMRNREVEKESMFNGIPFVMNLQDRAMTELMCDANGEPIYDRTQEHLGSSDAMVIAVRKQLLQAVRRMQDGGSPPANVDDVGSIESDQHLCACRLMLTGDRSARRHAMPTRAVRHRRICPSSTDSSFGELLW